ncbi:MAG: molybdopterin-dependent oxidoreductase [Proteobacteria bacterium]|nr:molybdopterin-dependent oxidoreductase [Pseudomonadota bacterium]
MQTKSVCCYCGVGCGVVLDKDVNGAVRVSGDPDHPANYGRLCTKGSALAEVLGGHGRAAYPWIRQERGGESDRADWSEALDYCADQFARIIDEYGPDSVAFYISGQLLTEDYYVFNKLAKGLIGTNNIDTNSRLCMSSAVAGYKQVFGVDAPPACYEDIEQASCFFIAGSNTAYAHPVLFRRIEDACRIDPDKKIIVVDPRKTLTAHAAHLHLPVFPGTDVMLFNGMLKIMLEDDLCNWNYIEHYTSGFSRLRLQIEELVPQEVADICGIPVSDLYQAAHLFAQSDATLSLYCQGLNQSSHGTDKNMALLNLHLATGQIGRAGAGPLSLTGQPNAMGGREVGGMATLLPGHREVSNPQHRQEVADFWGIDKVSSLPGKPAVDLFDSLRCGQIKAVWIACTNPVQSMPNQAAVIEALCQARFVVVQDAYEQTDTTAYADVFLPAASWAEKEGTMTNSERRITHVKPAVEPPGLALPDWEIVVRFASCLGLKLGKDSQSLFPYRHVSEVFDEHCQSTRGQDLDITGLSYGFLDSHGPTQWPCPSGSLKGRSRLYETGRFSTTDGLAHFQPVSYAPLAETISPAFPILFNTGRLRDQWHGMSRTGKIARLCNHTVEPVLSMNRFDMQRRGLKNGQTAKVCSSQGNMITRVEASEEMYPQQAFFPMHWGKQYMTSGGCNLLIKGWTDPVSHQPELKNIPIQVEAVDLPWEMVILRQGDVNRRMQVMQSMLACFDYANLSQYGLDAPVLVFRVAASRSSAPELLQQIDEMLDMGDERSIASYSDSRRDMTRRMLIEEGKLTGLRLCGQVQGWERLREVMASGKSTDNLGLWLLAPGGDIPGTIDSRGRIVCACKDVSESEISACVRDGADFEHIQALTGCGTQCGSCLGQLRMLVESVEVLA